MLDLLQTIVAGILATAVMSSVLYLFHWRGFANADMIRALGSLLTRSEDNALILGLAIHFTSGVVFAFVYLVFWSLWGIEALGTYVALGAFTGAAHGLVVSFLLVSLIAGHHPLPRFQEAGIGVAVAHLLGHVVYGVVVGLVAGAYGLRYDFIPLLAQFPE